MKPTTAAAKAMPIDLLQTERARLKRLISESCALLDAVERQLRRRKRDAKRMQKP